MGGPSAKQSADQHYGVNGLMLIEDVTYELFIPIASLPALTSRISSKNAVILLTNERGMQSEMGSAPACMPLGVRGSILR